MKPANISTSHKFESILPVGSYNQAGDSGTEVDRGEVAPGEYNELKTIYSIHSLLYGTR